MCRYSNWIDEVNVVCNIQYNKHRRMRINNYMNINMIRFRVGAWRINVNNLNMKQIVRSERHCDYCITNNCGKFCEDEEHVIFHCEAYGNCRLRHQPLFHGTEHNLETFLSNDNQTGIAGYQENYDESRYGMLTRFVELVFCYVSICTV